MKKILAVLLIISMLFTVTACDLDDYLPASNSSGSGVNLAEIDDSSESASTDSSDEISSDNANDLQNEESLSESSSDSLISKQSSVSSTTVSSEPELVPEESTIEPEESEPPDLPSSSSSTTQSSSSKSSTQSSTPKSSTSKPDFPGSDYQAFLDGTLIVYIAASGKGTKYHDDPTYSNMNNNVISMTKSEAEARGYGPCQRSKCFGHYF